MADATKPPKSGRTESQVMAQVIDAARMLGIDLERRNTGAAVNPQGQTVRFGSVGGSDWFATLPDGRHLDLEIKREGFDPGKLRGAKREHFDRQLARLRKTNELGGVGLWTDDAAQFLEWMRLILAGARVVEHGDRIEIVYPEGR